MTGSGFVGILNVHNVLHKISYALLESTKRDVILK